MLIFIDFEASRLDPDAWPIKVGFARIAPDGVIDGVGLPTRPDPFWPVSAWSPRRATIHRISREQITRAVPAEDVARWVAETVGDLDLISGLPQFDHGWLDRLLATGPNAPNLTIKGFHDVA